MVSFNGKTILSDTAGVYQFTPGMFTPVRTYVAMPRTIGNIAKDLRVEGPTHELVLTYLNVALSDINDTFDDLEDLALPLNGQSQSGSLVIPDYGTYPHCVIDSIVPSPQTARAKNITPDDTAGTKTYDLVFTITFKQLRRRR